jgi:hypothetical protein
MFKFIFKWTFRLVLAAVILAVLLAVGLALSLDTIVRVVAERNIRAGTGLEAEIGQFHVGLAEPVISIRDLKIYNGPEFGGAPFVDIPEIRVEYDRAALRRHELHLTLLRLNLAELAIVKNEAGRTNLFALGAALPAAGKKPGPEADSFKEFRRKTGMKFDGIDLLNLSVGRFKYIDLQNPRNNREQKVDIESFPVRNVRSLADLTGVTVLLTLRSGDFFQSLVLPGKAGR